MGLNIRHKGARGEREVIQMFQLCMEQVEETFSVGMLPDQFKNSRLLKRNSMQADAGGHDIVGIPGLSIEVKRAEVLQVETWWKQCFRQATKLGYMPALFYRKNRTAWRVRCYVLMPNGKRWYLAEMLAVEFMDWYRCYYENYLREKLTKI